MNFTQGILLTIILIGAIQGIITGVLLFNAAHNRRANRILAILLWLMALVSLNLCIDYTGWYNSSMLISILHSFIPMELIMPIGPLIYFYIHYSLDAGFTITKKQRRHFYPVFLDLVPQIAALVFITGVLMHKFVPNPGPWGIFIDTWYIYVDIPRWVSLAFYTGLSWKYIAPIKANNTAPQQAATIKWLQLVIKAFAVFVVIWFIYLVPYIIPASRDGLLKTFSWYPIYIPLAVLIYWLGIKGYINSIAGKFRAKEKKAMVLPGQTIQETMDKLARAMEEDKLYLNPSLNINLLSQHTGIAAKTISAVLNQHIGKGFNEYVNTYRVQEFKQKLFEPGMEQLTITGIAFECGFNSQATFQRTFKQVTGMSPSEFRDSIAKTT